MFPKQYVFDVVNAHNDNIDAYINGELAEKLGAVDGKINAEQWFTAQRFIKEQRFYERGKKILDAMRAAGWDVKMDMQSNKLVFKGERI